MFFSSKQEEKLAFFFCPCCKTNLRSATSAILFFWLSYPLREGKHGLEKPAHFLLPWKIKQMNLAAFWFITTPLIISNKAAERLIPYCVKRVALVPRTWWSPGPCAVRLLCVKFIGRRFHPFRGLRPTPHTANLVRVADWSGPPASATPRGQGHCQGHC